MWSQVVRNTKDCGMCSNKPRLQVKSQQMSGEMSDLFKLHWGCRGGFGGGGSDIVGESIFLRTDSLLFGRHFVLHS